MANWDIFHADRLEAERRSLSTEAVRAAVASGAIRPDDLIRPAGSSDSWARVGDTPAFKAAPPSPPREPKKPPVPREATPASKPPPPSPPEEPVLDAELVDDVDDDEVEEAAPTPDEPEPEPEPILDAEFAEDDDEEPAIPDEPVFDAQFVEDDDLDFDDDIPAPPEPVVEEEQTVELRRPPDAPKPQKPLASQPRPGPGATSAAGAAGAGAGATGAGAIPSPGLSDPEAGPVAETSAEGIDGPELYESIDPIEEDEEAASFTLAAEPRGEPDEIDLTAMVDVAFQLVLFFLVTATTLYFKTLEIPTPEPEDQDAVAQQMRTLDDLLEEYILVEIDDQGRVQVDREPVDIDALTDRLRQVRSDTLRTGGMLLMANFATPHRNAVQAIDSANALGMQIAIAKPGNPPE